MSRDIQKKQRKLQKKKSKQKAKKKAIARQSSQGKRGEFALAARYPVLHACEFVGEGEHGISQVLLSRRLGGGNVAFALFLIDLYCLGVKNVIAQIVPEGSYHWNLYDKLNENHERFDLSPADARKLVEDSVEYARGLGLPPVDDYRKAYPIFGDIDPQESDAEFKFGQDGKPFFASGPHDSSEKCRRIIATLQETCGEGNFHYMMAVTPDTLGDWGDLDELGQWDEIPADQDRLE